MNCNDIDQALDKGAITIAQEREIEEHLIGCSRCRKLVEVLSQPQSETSVSSTPLLEQIERRLLSDLHPVRRTKKEYLLIALATIFVVGVAFGVYRIGAFALAVMTHLQAGVMLSAVVIAAVLASYSLVNLILPGNLQPISPSILPWGVALFFATATVLLFQFQQERHFWPAAWWCIRTGTEFGALAAVPLWFVLRRGAVLLPVVTGLVSGLFLGLVGVMALEIHCPILDARHILFAHLGVLVILSTVGLAVGAAVEKLHVRRLLP
jgi:hypothetical protein